MEDHMALYTTDRLALLFRAVLILCLVPFTASCIFDEYADEEEGDGLQFVIRPSMGTKVLYDGLHSAFENGEAIGCVIAEKSGSSVTYRVNTKWVFDNNVLMLQDDVPALIQRHSAPEKADEGYVELMDGDMAYMFFFYYPYIDNAVLDSTYPNTGGQYLVQTPVSGNWKSLPLFVNIDQSTKEKINKSDFLWVGYTEDMKTSSDIRKSNATYPVSLEFSRKTASVDVVSDAEITDLRMKGRSSTQTVTRGGKIDLSTGLMTPYTSSGSIQYDNRHVTSSHEGIRPYNMEAGDGHRFILPPQDDFSATLSFTINGVGYDADLSRLSVLEEGKRYLIYIMSDDGSIIINDWENDYIGDLVVDNPRVHVVDAVKYKAGAVITIVGADMDLVSKIRIPGAGDISDFSVSDDNMRIEFILPDSAVDGAVYLVAKSGDLIKVGDFETVKPKVSSFSANPVNVNSILTLSGTDLDLVTDVVFGGNAVVPVTPDESEINVTVPVNAVDGYLKLNLVNGMSVTVDMEELRIADSPLCRITSLPGTEIKGGTVLTVTVINGNRLTAVRIDGESASYALEGSSLSIQIPKAADEGTVLTLVSTVDMTEYEVSYVIDCIPDRFVEEVLWSGTYTPGQKIFDSSVFNWGSLDPSSGRVILVFDFLPLTSDGTLILQNGWWQDLPENTSFSLTAGQTQIEVEFTPSMISLLKTTSNSLLVRGNNYTLTKLTLKREI